MAAKISVQAAKPTQEVGQILCVAESVLLRVPHLASLKLPWVHLCYNALTPALNPALVPAPKINNHFQDCFFQTRSR